MPNSKVLEKIKRKIHQEWKVDDPDLRFHVELNVFMAGQNFIDFGTIKLKDVYPLLQARLLFVKSIEINWEDFEYVELHPDFRKACELYQRPDNFIPREEMLDFYEQPYDPADIFETNDEVDIDPNDPRGEDVHLFSEKRLLEELKTRNREWLIYRTPYRPIETERLEKSILDSIVNRETA